MTRSGTWTRLTLEAVTIVGSILLAFAIDAWWTSRGEREGLRQHLDAVRSELEANRGELQARLLTARGALAAAQELVRVSSPSPVLLQSDSLGRLIHTSFNFGGANPATAALDAFLAGNASDIASDPALHAALLRLRAGFEEHNVNAAIFAEIRETVIGYLTAAVPMAVVSHNTGAHEATDFPVPVQALLSDPRFEGHIGNLAVRILVLSQGLEALVEGADSVLLLLRARAF